VEPQGLVIPLYKADAQSLLARHAGRLQIRGSCHVIVDVTDGAHTVAWPMPGTEWDPSTQMISIDGVAAPVGAIVSLIGGEGHITEADLSGDHWIVAPAISYIENPIWFAGAMIFEVK
jgi:hypothetical protein